jgi:hypothetical protein
MTVVSYHFLHCDCKWVLGVPVKSWNNASKHEGETKTSNHHQKVSFANAEDENDADSFFHKQCLTYEESVHKGKKWTVKYTHRCRKRCCSRSRKWPANFRQRQLIPSARRFLGSICHDSEKACRRNASWQLATFLVHIISYKQTFLYSLERKLPS